jgi:hypothetical protein
MGLYTESGGQCYQPPGVSGFYGDCMSAEVYLPVVAGLLIFSVIQMLAGFWMNMPKPNKIQFQVILLVSIFSLILVPHGTIAGLVAIVVCWKNREHFFKD